MPDPTQDATEQAREFWQRFPPEVRPGEGARVELSRDRRGELQAFWDGYVYGVRGDVAYRARLLGPGPFQVTVWRHGERADLTSDHSDQEP